MKIVLFLVLTAIAFSTAVQAGVVDKCLYGRSNMEQKARIGRYSGYSGGNGSALIEATAKEDVECMKILIAAGANLDAKDEWPWRRPIHIAAEKENYTLMDLLLDNGADIDAIHNGGNALETATQVDRIDVAKYLIGRGANVGADIQSSNILMSVIWWYYNKPQTYVSDTFKLIVETDKTVLEKRGWNGYTPYLYACYTGNQAVVDYLVEKGSNTEAKTTDGKTCSVLCREKLANGKFDGCIAITDCVDSESWCPTEVILCPASKSVRKACPKTCGTCV